MNRNRLFEIVERADYNDRASAVYDVFMIVVIVTSLVPLAFKVDNAFLTALDRICALIFMADYILRWFTADLRFGKNTRLPFLKYPFSAMALIDLTAILPSLFVANGLFNLLRMLKIIRALRVLRVFKALRYSKSFIIIRNVLHDSREPLLAVCAFAGGYILVSALVVFNVEPDTFESFFDAVYWATVSLTTVGYGDIYPVSALGRVVTMLSSLFGIAIVALPAGIITAGYMSELTKERGRSSKSGDGNDDVDASDD